MTRDLRATEAEKIFAGGGEMGALMRSHNWSQTPLGAVESWPQSLRTIVSVLLNSRYPMFVWWGSELAALYNDAYRPILGASKHPQFLGNSAKQMWAEIWDTLGPLTDIVLSTGQPTWSEDLLLLMDRYGYREETYFTFSYSPVRDESGGVGGVFCACTETTERILGERRLRSLRELATHTAEAKTVEEACRLAIATLCQNPYDIPFALLYLLENEGEQARLLGTAGIEGGTLASPQEIALSQEHDRWNMNQVKRTGEAKLVNDLSARSVSLSAEVWEESIQAALVMPLKQSGQKQQLAGLLVLGISPRREFDDEYRGFFDLVASHIMTAIAKAQVYQEERQRAESLAELDRAKTLFFSNVSHEFRTPLTLMLSPLEDMLTVADDVPFATQRQSLELMHRNGLRLLKLVNTLLEFSRIEAGRIEASYEPTELAAFTRELASVFDSVIERVGMRLLVDCPSLPEPAYVDRQMWEKIVLNLLSNAFKFTFTGEIIVRLYAANPKSVILEVQDTGIGIPAAELPHLFERFHRVKGAQGRTFEGSGIGLSLVQELVRLHGGTVNVTSTLGQGSCFTVSIPTGSAHLPPDRIDATRTLQSTALGAASYLEEVLRWLPEEDTGRGDTATRGRGDTGNEEDTGTLRHGDTGNEEDTGTRGHGDTGNEEDTGTRGHGDTGNEEDTGTRGHGDTGNEKNISASPSLPLSASPPLPLSASPPRILLVDDNADMRNYLKRLLSARYEIEFANNGVAALAAVRRQLPDLVLTDVMMPELDGFGLLRELRSDPITRRIPVILLSARAGEESRVEGLEAGADDYLVKPFSARELLARVEANLKMSQMRQEAYQKQQALRITAEAATEQLENVLSRIDDQFVVLDRQWRYLYLNDRVVEATGMPREALLGRSVWELFPDTLGSEFETQYQRAMTEQIPVHFEYFYPAWNRWFENHVYPSADGLTILVTEITERKQTQQQLQQTLQTLETLIASSPLPIVVIESGNVVQLWNPAAELLFGWSEAEVLGKLLPIVPDEKLEECLLQVQEPVLRGEILSGLETYRCKRDGSKVGLTISAAPIYDEQGSVNAIMLIFQDISERQQAEKMLAQREAELRLVTDTVPALISFVDADQRYRFNNRGYEEWFGYPATEFYGKHIREVLGETAYEAILPYVEQVLAGEPVTFESQIPYREGGSRYVIATYVPQFDNQRTVQGFVVMVNDISDRKQAELQLQETQRFNQQITETIPGIVFIYDLIEQRIMYVNHKVAELLGYTAEQIQAMGADLVATTTHPEDLERLSTHLEAFRSGSEQTISTIEYRSRHADGSWLWLYNQSIVFNRTEEGSPRQILGVAIDISDRKQVEVELRDSEIELQQANKRFEQAAMAVNCLIYDWNVESDSIIRTQGLTRILGYTLEEAEPTGAWWRALIHPEDLPRVLAETAMQMQDRDRYTAEYRIRHKNNHYVYIQDQGIVTKDANGNWMRVVGSTIDISERKQTEAILREKEQFLQSLTNNVPVMLWTALPDGTIDFVSQPWMDYTGMDLASVSREGWRELIHPDDFDTTLKAWNHSSQTGQPYEIAHRFRRSDGQFHWCISRAVLIRDEQMNPQRWVGSAVDIEYQKQSELTLQRTTELLEKRNQELDRFAYVVSHDLKAPLRAITNLSQWLEDDLEGQLPEENQQQMRLLRQRGYRMEALIDGLLAYSRADRSQTAAEKVDVGELLDEVIDSLAPPPSFSIEVQPGMPQIITKRILLSQVFANLISNAIKHHERPDGRVEISFRRRGNRYEFTVSDDGPGIDPEYHEKIFNIFQTLKAKDIQENTGIGLSIVKKIIETEGGEIKLESEAGKGSTFRFTWLAESM